ncbi:MAG: glutamate--cysteine ligase [Gammaproteobacteria bacterium]|jgi:hypothetical protein|nr:glutamate--cysteine ligase [Gammaproteobacteria bacterium]
MGQEINAQHFHKRDFNHFEQALQEETALLSSWFEEGVFSTTEAMVGLELEAWLVNQQLCPAPSNQPFITTMNHPLVVPELASFNIEINSTPQPLSEAPYSALTEELNTLWGKGEQVASRMDNHLIMIGTLPTAEEDDLILANMSEQQRYRALNEQVLRMRGGAPLRFEIEGHESLQLRRRDVMMEAATTSLQIHLQVPFEQSVTAFNSAIQISAAMVALCANAPYLFGRDLWEDSRIPLFEQAVNVEPLSHRLGEGRVSFGTGYARHSLLEFFIENRDHYPVMLPICQPLPTEELPNLMLHNGTVWRWNRPLVGFDQAGAPHLRIEHRVASAGPTPMDVTANTLFFVCVVMGMVARPDRRAKNLSFIEARRNFYQAARYGMESEVRWQGGKSIPLRTLLQQELIPLARVGIAYLGLAPREWQPWFELIEERVQRGQNGSCWQRQWVARHGPDFSGLMGEYLEQQCSGNPVHEWSISG